jgi:hypothetical protein
MALAQQEASQFEATGLDKPAQDITFAGTVDQLNTARTPGAPAGDLLTVNGPQGIVTSSLGRNLNPQEQQTLINGTPVQIT